MASAFAMRDGRRDAREGWAQAGVCRLPCDAPGEFRSHIKTRRVQSLTDSENYIMKKFIGAVLLILCSGAVALAQDPGWPRKLERSGSTLIYYQPQVDDWKSFTDLTWRMAFSLTPAGGKEVVGVMDMQGHTDVDNENKMVTIDNLKITRINFPSLAAADIPSMDAVVRSFLPASVSISLHRLVAVAQKPDSVSGVPLQNAPPVIFTSTSPAILLAVDGKPALAEIPQANLEFVVNTTWPVFLDTATSSYFLLIGQQWVTANSLGGPWSPAARLPAGMSKVAADPQWAALKSAIAQPGKSNGAIPQVFYSEGPAEVILFDGEPVYAKIPGTKLLYSTNTSSYLFLHAGENQYYYLTGGRWFRAKSLQGPWNFATLDLPADFGQIPASSPAAIVLTSVPGTEEAKDAVLLAQIPTTMTVNPATAAANVKVSYGGDPHFEPITGTALTYATNTEDKVIKAGDVYYLCLQGVWFISTSAQGPWTVASSVPQVIYTIPPSSPVYNVTYVTQTTVPGGYVQSSYTAGYVGAFIVGAAVGAIIANGSGYYYPPYIYRPPYGYPRYYPPPYTYGAYGAYGGAAHYNAATGAYGASRTVSGPYGTATRGASYNPYTGTAARGATVSTPYGSRSAGQAYNPYTGASAATRQGSSPTAQWGSSVVSKGNQSAYTQHYSTAQGTAASARTASGGKVAGTNTAYGSSTAGKTSTGDMYASRDGNVYKNTGSGWQSYNNSGGWNTAKPATSTSAQQRAQTYQQPQTTGQGVSAANKTAAQTSAQNAQRRSPASASGANGYSAASSSQMQGLQQEAQSRQRGAQTSQRFAQAGGGASAGFGAGRGR
jgi:hypothetical protein